MLGRRRDRRQDARLGLRCAAREDESRCETRQGHHDADGEDHSKPPHSVLPTGEQVRAHDQETGRPPLLFPTPEPLTVLAEIPEGPPARFTWRRVMHRVVKSEGPERIAPEWWRGLVREGRTSETINSARPRDYYRIEDEDGHRYWVFREGLYQEAGLGPPSWYLHGVFG